MVIHALRDINLHLTQGARVALVGHNGAGKSTMLQLLSGVYEPSSGSARIEGKVSSLLNLSMGMDPEQTGRYNIFPLYTSPSPRDRQESRMPSSV